MAELYGQRIQTLVQNKYLPYGRHNPPTPMSCSSALYARLKDGAVGRFALPIKYAKTPPGTSFRGFDTFSVSANG